jgi:molybdate transport system substrate-binding protein
VNSSKLTILSGGAAHGLVAALAAQFKAQSGCEIDGTFGAVGAMRDKLLSGTAADLLILTRALIDELAAQGHVVPDSVTNVGTVLTAIAVRRGDSLPDVGNAAGLRAALQAADAIYIPDPKLATAGIHFARVIDRLGLTAEVASRIRTYPNGATAMRELAAARGGRPIGCTQVTEILNPPGAQLVAPLPEGFELATVYTAGVCARAAAPHRARELAALLAGDAARAARQRAGFV